MKLVAAVTPPENISPYCLFEAVIYQWLLFLFWCIYMSFVCLLAKYNISDQLVLNHVLFYNVNCPVCARTYLPGTEIGSSRCLFESAEIRLMLYFHPGNSTNPKNTTLFKNLKPSINLKIYNVNIPANLHVPIIKAGCSCPSLYEDFIEMSNDFNLS